MREPVELPKSYRLLNHGPTVLVSAAHGGLRNVMAAAWSMPLDFSPPKVAVVIDKATYTRELVEASGQFALNVPCVAIAEAALALGQHSGRELDKFAAFGLGSFQGTAIGAPLVEGCVGWLECRVLPEPRNQALYDLFIGEVVAAWADPRVFQHGRWRPDAQREPGLRTLHYVAGGHFFAMGDSLDVTPTPAP